VTVCAFFGFGQLGGLGSQVGQITNFDIPCGSGGRLKMFASGRFRRSYATGERGRHKVALQAAKACSLTFVRPDFTAQQTRLYHLKFLIFDEFF